MDNIWVYRKKRENIQEFDKVLAEIQQPHSSYCIVYTDQDKNRIAYEQMKKDICETAGYTEDTENKEEQTIALQEKIYCGILIVKNLTDLGNTKKDVLKELEWISDHQLMLALIDYPVTHVFDRDKNRIALGTMIDLMKSLQGNKLFEITSTGYEKGGRPRVQYPENWPELYRKWEEGTLTAGEFLRLSGLKKGTFYHLIVDYKNSIAGMKERRKIG